MAAGSRATAKAKTPKARAAQRTRGATRQRSGPSRAQGTATDSQSSSEDGRTRILKAAIRQFAEQGFDATTTVAIAREAGVTQPDVHHHFASKKKLWEAAVDAIFARFGSYAASLVPAQPSPDPMEQARALLEGFVLAASELTDLPKLIAREGGTPSERLDYLVANHVGPLLQGSAELLRRAQHSGFIRRRYRPELLLFLILGAADHIFTVRAMVNQVFGADVQETRTRDAFAKMFVDVMLEGVHEPK